MNDNIDYKYRIYPNTNQENTFQKYI
ncbi:helix-turn-helix domain-containing protein [Borreliella americana]